MVSGIRISDLRVSAHLGRLFEGLGVPFFEGLGVPFWGHHDKGYIAFLGLY